MLKTKANKKRRSFTVRWLKLLFFNLSLFVFFCLSFLHSRTNYSSLLDVLHFPWRNAPEGLYLSFFQKQCSRITALFSKCPFAHARKLDYNRLSSFFFQYRLSYLIQMISRSKFASKTPLWVTLGG